MTDTDGDGFINEEEFDVAIEEAEARGDEITAATVLQ